MNTTTHHHTTPTLSAKRAAACAVLSDDDLNIRLCHPRVIDGLLRDMQTVVVTETDDAGVDDLINGHFDVDRSAEVEDELGDRWDGLS